MMSGTSADGIDGAAISLDETSPPQVTLLATVHHDYPPELRARVLDAASGKSLTAADLARLHAAIGDAYANTAAALLLTLDARPDVIAMHGQTVAHLPAQRATLQLGDPSRVAECTGVATVADFRGADLAAGGEGAPLVPFADHVLFGGSAPIAALNLGGIANLTLMPTDRAEDVVAFDTGPANMLSDLIAQRLGRLFDEAGAGAGRGRVLEGVLARALADPYFARRAPKSTGREEFGERFAGDLYDAVMQGGGTTDDALATALAVTVRTVADALRRETPPAVRWKTLVVGGGGARNPTLLALMRDAVAPVPVQTIDELGIPAEAREAVAFAILGAFRLRGLPNTLPSATGAKRAVSAGAIYRP